MTNELTDDELREAIVRHEWDQFQRTNNEGGRAACQGNWPVFHQMRLAQFLTWERPLLTSYAADLDAADHVGRNLVTEKYGRMMASTAPENFTKNIEPYIPRLSEERAARQEQVIAQQVAWAKDFRERYPKLGEAMRDFAYADELLSRLPELDFVIGSQHQLSEKYDWNDLYFMPEATEQEAREQIADYLTLVLETAKWGKFSVLGHLTLPLRYMNENHGMHMTFDGFEDEVAQVFRALIENGCGIECNVNRGNTPLPDAKWLRLYHELGGEIITIGTDAHTPEFVGMRARETQELLKSCGLNYVCTFEKKKPVFHKI